MSLRAKPPWRALKTQNPPIPPSTPAPPSLNYSPQRLYILMSPLLHSPQTFYLGLGSNLGNREAQLQRAINLLNERVGEVTAVSSFIETAPQGFQSDNAFLNAAVSLVTHHSAEEVLMLTQAIEREMGRTEKSTDGHYHDRPIDIDLLVASAERGGPEVFGKNLTLPHPHLAERDFVLRPLCEIAPDLSFVPWKSKRRIYVDEALANLEGPHIEELTELPTEHSKDLLQSINDLLPQLSASATPLTKAQLGALVANPYTHLYLLYDDDKVVRGMVTLCLCASPTGTKCWAEDVVVDSSCRGRGYGRALMERIKIYARHLGAKSLNFTSQPARIAANKLYRSLHYDLRKTNVYRWNLK